MRRIHDITMTFSSGMPNWPGNPAPEVTRFRDMKEGDRNNMTSVAFHVHSGTHVDAPLHFVADGYPIEDMPLDVLIGPCLVAHFPDVPAITRDMLVDHPDIGPGVERLLLRTVNSDRFGDAAEFRPDFTALTPDAAQWLVEGGIRLLGNDYLSVERYKEPGNATHLAFLENEVILLEGIDMRGIEPGRYELVCLPMKIGNAEGAPARAVLIER